MAESSNPKPRLSDPESSGGRCERQDTVLLSDVPEPSAFIRESTLPQGPLSNLSSVSLAALGQRYDILAEAGHGSMGNVYKARDRETGETVALKLLKPEIASDQAMMDRFKNELLFARKITHKNVCRVHEFNRIGGLAYTSMEFVEGESLRSVLNRFGGLPVRKAISVTEQICSGLKEAHAQGIVHRDLKPENVMIDSQGNVKIMDFGIARSMESLTRLTGSMVGTPAYMAPEQVAGKHVDYRTDIYSLGLMLYEMFTGSQAFQADTAVALALKQMRETPPAPHEVDPSIPVGIERAILKCLEKEPGKRFQSVVELENALRSASGPANATPPPSAPPTSSGRIAAPIPSPISPVMKPAPKRTPAITWVLVGALLVVGGAEASRWAAAAKSAEQLPPPAPLPAPRPPEFALFIPPAPVPVAMTPKVISSAAVTTKAVVAKAPAVRPTPAESVAAVPVLPPPVTPLRKPETTASKAEPPADVQRRAERAFGEAKSAATKNGSKYLWIGRYQKQDRAQTVEKKIKELGLDATVVTRHGSSGEFYVVFAGPFGTKRVPSVMEWLKTQGFAGVHEVSPPGGNQNSSE
jgi:serine/threonine protein kinase